MDVPKPGVKRDPRRRWALPDRIFFAHGACHILAGVNLERPPLPGFHAERIVPAGPYPGNHVFVTDGVVAFDYHGYSLRSRLLEHHDRVWASQHAGWSGDVVRVDFDLLSTAELNRRKMRGADQFFGDAVIRARDFIARRDHVVAASRASGTGMRATRRCRPA